MDQFVTDAVLNLVKDSKKINISIEELPLEFYVGLSLYLSFGSGELDDVMKRKPHPHYIFQYQTEKALFKQKKSLIYHCGCLFDVFEPILKLSWEERKRIIVPDNAIPLVSKETIHETLLANIVLEKSEYRNLNDGCVSLATLFKDWNLQFSEDGEYESQTTIYSKFITFKDLTFTTVIYPLTNEHTLLEKWTLYLKSISAQFGMYKRSILIIGEEKSGKSTLARRLCQYYRLDYFENTNVISSSPYGFVIDHNSLNLSAILETCGTHGVKDVIVLSPQCINEVANLAQALEKVDANLHFFDKSFFEYKCCNLDPEVLAYPEDDFLFQDNRYEIWQVLTQKLKAPFAYKCSSKYLERENERIRAYKEFKLKQEHPPIEEFKYQIPTTDRSKEIMKTMDKVLPIIVEGLKCCDLSQAEQTIKHLGQYLLSYHQ